MSANLKGKSLAKSLGMKGYWIGGPNGTLRVAYERPTFWQRVCEYVCGDWTWLYPGDQIVVVSKINPNSKERAMNEEIKSIEQVKADLDAANRCLDWLGQQIDGCGKYTKDGETIAQALERNWQDSQNLLGELATERMKREAAEKKLSGANLAVECNVGKDGAWITLKCPKGSFTFQPIHEFGIHDPFRSKVLDWAEYVQQFAISEDGK